MKIKKNVKWILLVLLTVLLVVSCDSKDKNAAKKKQHIVVAKMQTPIQHFYFAGSLLPISNVAVISPVAGTIKKIFFSYGGKIESGQKLVIIDSEELAKTYRTAVTTFLKAKQSFNTSKASFLGTKALYAAGIYSKSQYSSDKNTHDDAALSFLQATYNLKKVLKTAYVGFEKIEHLSISNTKQVKEIFEKEFHHFYIAAPGSGIALFPSPSDSSDNSSSSGRLHVGSRVKDGQLILSIGDLSGLSAKFKVSEVDINFIHKGMSVTVTGDSFPDITLHGIVDAVSSQASQDSGSAGVSMFAVKTIIPKVTPEQMKMIRVGMTAKFEISIKSQPRIMLPVNAVFQKDGQSMVNLVGTDGKATPVPVVPGYTSPTKVVIISGIKVGDRVMVDD